MSQSVSECVVPSRGVVPIGNRPDAEEEYRSEQRGLDDKGCDSIVYGTWSRSTNPVGCESVHVVESPRCSR